MKANRLYFIISFTLVALVMSAQKPMTLDECINMAIERSLQTEGSRIALDGTEVDIRQAKHARYPNLSFNTNVGWNFGRTIDPTENLFVTETFFNNGGSLSSNVVLFAGNRINNSIKQSEANNKAALKDLEQTRKDISLQVASTYLNILFAKENLRNSQNQLLQTKDQRDMVDRQIAVGNLPENDRMDVEAQIAVNEQTVIENENQLAILLLNMKQMLRMEPDAVLDIVFPENIGISTDPDLITYNELFQTALTNQSSVEADKMRLKSAELGQKIASAELLPVLAAAGNMRTNYSNKSLEITGYDRTVIEQDILFNGQNVTIGFPQDIPRLKKSPYFGQINDNISYGVGLSLSVPIYNNLNGRSSVQRAKLNTQRAQLAYDQGVESLKITVGQAYADAKSAKSRYAATEKTKNAQTLVYNNAIKRFNAGDNNIFELNRLKALMEGAEINYLIAKYDYIFRSRVLDYYLGKPIRLD